MHTRKRIHRFVRLGVCLASAIGWPFVTGSAGIAQAAEPAPSDQVVVVAGQLHMALGKTEQGLRVLSLTDTAASRQLLADEALPLFTATFRDTQTKEMLTVDADSGWQQVEASPIGEPGRYALTFGMPLDDRLKGIRVEIDIAALSEENALSWDLRVDNRNARWGLWRVAFPVVSVRDLGADGRVFLPMLSGLELAGLWSKTYKRGGTYPSGWICMQYLAAYDKTARTGLYVGVHDPWGSTKDIFGESRPDHQAVILRFEHPVANMGRAGAGFNLPGEARWQLLRGDWFDAAQIYRAWVRRRALWWPPLGHEGREDTPLWMRQLPAWVMTGGAASDCVPRVKSFAQALDLPVGFHWYNWHQIPFDNDYPHYFPAKEGFAQGVADLKAAGVHPMPYINGRLWDTHDKGAANWQFANTALASATKDEQGEPYIETYNSKETDGNSVKLAAMCPATPLWQEKVREIVLRLFGECGVSGVYIDQVAAASPRLCFDAAHGHDLGGGHWWTAGYWAMLTAIRRAKPADRMLTTECNAEPYIKWFDGYLTWHWQNQDMVPAFPAVYGGAIQMFGRAYRGGPSQDLAGRMKAGQQLVFGEQIGWFGPELIERPESGGFLRDCIRLRWRLKEYFYKGQMARPPRLTGPIPTVTADWQWHGEWPVTTDAVMTGAWRMVNWREVKENRTVLLFANVSDEGYCGPVQFDPSEYGLANPSFTAVAIGADGTKTPITIRPDERPTLTIAPRSVLAWELAPAQSN
ncbi:MAG: hypothetical protein JW810_12315 [Sedimentisphaerales bacterium]|nr:hypothetical protein [Sedimentisphaerales bacterium]